MVVERIKQGALDVVAERFRTRGRLVSSGVEYVDSWLAMDGSICYQLMRAVSREALEEWMQRWSDIISFEVHEVLLSSEFWLRRNASSAGIHERIPGEGQS